MAFLLISVFSFFLLPSVEPLFCYTCVFPTFSPLDCIHYPTWCSAGQRCLSSKAIGQKGDIQVVLYEKSCVLPSLCGITGEKFAIGINFTFTNECCDTQLCNGAVAITGIFCSLLPAIFTFLFSL